MKSDYKKEMEAFMAKGHPQRHALSMAMMRDAKSMARGDGMTKQQKSAVKMGEMGMSGSPRRK